VNEGVNEEWISDKTRFACDGLKRQRLDQPYLRRNGKLEPASWSEAFAAIAAQLKATAPQKIAAIVGDLAAAEEVKALKDLMRSFGVANLDCRQDGAKLAAAPRQGYLFNSTLQGLEAADAILLVGTNPRWEAPVLNARLRKMWLTGNVKSPIWAKPMISPIPFSNWGRARMCSRRSLPIHTPSDRCSRMPSGRRSF